MKVKLAGFNPKAKPFKLTPPKPFIRKEYDEQVYIFEHFKRHPMPGSDMLYATLNGVRLPIGLAVKMSKAGLKKGPLDMNLDIAHGGFFAARAELKRTKGGVVSPEQKLWIARLTEEGFLAAVVRGADEGITFFTNYLKMPKTVAIPFATE